MAGSRRAPLLLCLLAAGCGGGAGSGPSGPRNVLLISIDTLRADHLSCYGYGRETSPALDAFARGGRLFENAIAESSWTIPSHLTLLTGLHPLHHGVRRPDLRLPAEVAVLPETLRGAGYYTFALTGGGWLSETWGFDRGFDFFSASREEDLATTLGRAAEFLRFRRPRGPFFGFIHTYDVHCPYDPPEPYASRFVDPLAEPFDLSGKCGNPELNSLERTQGQDRFVLDRYDAGIAWADDALGEFFRMLEDEGFFEDTLVIVTSDHGEELGERGSIGHERTLRGEVLRIPLVVRGPGVAAGRTATPVGLRDVVPTVLELLGLEPGAPLDGSSLTAELAGGHAPWAAGRTLVSDLAWQRDLVSSWDATGTQILLDRASGEGWRIPTTEDGLQGEPRSATHLELEELARLEAELSEARLPEVEVDVGPGLAEDLRALGYVTEDL